jgi:hypothetical protein
MKLFKFSLGCLLLACCSLGARAQNDFCGIKNTSFSETEKLSFRVYYNMWHIWVAAGDAVFSIKDEMLNGRKVYHVAGDGRTLSSYEWFFKVRDLYETYIDQETLLPLKFDRRVSEGSTKFENHVTFNRKTSQATSTHGTYKVPTCVQDVLSTIYYARNIDYSKYKTGDKIPFSMFLDDQVYNLYIRYLGKERVATHYGTFNTIKIAPLLIEGTIFSGGEKMVVWVSDDANHIPVRVESPILVGNITVDMMQASSLRNPMGALVKKK